MSKVDDVSKIAFSVQLEGKTSVAIKNIIEELTSAISHIPNFYDCKLDALAVVHEAPDIPTPENVPIQVKINNFSTYFHKYAAYIICL